MRFRLPRLLQLATLLLLLLSLLSASISYSVQARQSNPRCVLYYERAGNRTALKQYDPYSEQANPADYRYYAQFDVLHNVQYSPDRRNFMYYASARYKGINSLFAGTTGTNNLHLIATKDSLNGSWSPDSNDFAYTYFDGQVYYIAIVDRFGSHKRIGLLKGINALGLFVGGWSADKRYIMLNTLGDYNNVSSTVYFVATDTLQLLSTWIPSLFVNYKKPSGVVWSPQGHRFAYIDQTGSPLYLVIATPEQGTERNFPLNERNESSVGFPLRWSSDGRYVTVTRRRADRLVNENSSWSYWAYSIFGVDGSLHTGIKGQKLSLTYGYSPDAWWSADGATWFFRQHLYKPNGEEEDGKLISNLVAYHVDAGVEQVLAKHVAGSPLITDNGTGFVLPLWNNNKIAIGQFSVGTNTSATLAYDEANWKRIIHTDQPAVLHKERVIAGYNFFPFDQTFDEITDLYWLDDHRSLLYFARNGLTLTVSAVNLETGKVLVEIDNLVDWTLASPDYAWHPSPRVFSSPSGQMVVLMIGVEQHVSLYIVSLANNHVQHLLVDGNRISDVFWSPNDAAFAFTRWDGTLSEDVLQIVAADGRTLHQKTLSGGGESDLRGWAWCK